MSKKNILIPFLFFLCIECQKSENDNELIDSLIKENNGYYALYLFIFIASFIISLAVIFFINIKTEENQNIEINTTENNNLINQIEIKDLGLKNPPKPEEEKDKSETKEEDTERGIINNKKKIIIILKMKIVINQMK